MGDSRPSKKRKFDENGYAGDDSSREDTYSSLDKNIPPEDGHIYGENEQNDSEDGYIGGENEQNDPEESNTEIISEVS